MAASLHPIHGDDAGPHPFRVHFIRPDDGSDDSTVIWAMSPESARKAFAAQPKHQWAQVRKIKLDRQQKEHA